MSVLLVGAIALALLLGGIMLGRYYVPDSRPLRRAARQGGFYIRGLNHVLAQDREAAIAELSKAVTDHSASPETYFALGVLFRERGEVERAVRVHQSLLVRGDVDRRMRLEAFFQLGVDFEVAGFRRRARRAFEQVLDKDPKHGPAVRKLLALYEQEGSWEQAHKALVRLRKVEGKDESAHEAHLLTEMGLAALGQGDVAGARRLVSRAKALVPDSVHALYAEGQVQGERNRWEQAIEAFLAALHRAPDLAEFFFPLLEDAYYRLGELHRLSGELDRLIGLHPGNLHLRMVQARFLGKRDPALALPLIRGVLEDAPSLLPARRILGRIVIAAGDPEAAVKEYRALLDALERVERSYRCARCGHASVELFWRCPRCHAWDSVRVAWGRRSGEGDDTAEGAAIPGGAVERRQTSRRAQG